jgi:uncharacterized iron-regulated protein
MKPLVRVMAAVLALWLAMVGAEAPEAADWPGGWVSQGERDHPLVGKIYEVKTGRFVSAADYVAALSRAWHVLLGEIHDNGDHHRLQGFVVRRLEGGPRAVVFEQFRADQQRGLDAFVRGLAEGDEAPGAQVDKLFLVTGWSNSGWPDGALYAPLMRAVIEARAPILAGNPPRQRLMAVARQGLDAISSDARRRLLLDREMGAALDDALLDELEASHCGLMPKSAFGNMALAQRFRDGFMARVMADAAIAGKKSVLVSGNGHVRRDRGVPWYLSRMGDGQTGGDMVVVGHIEVDPARRDPVDYAEKAFYDFLVFTPVATRSDPCEKMRARFQKRGKRE